MGVQRRWMPYNGAHGEEQLAWLSTELAGAKAVGERVVVLTHVAVCPGACDDDTLSWDYDQVLKLLHDVGPGVVVAVFSGHDHKVPALPGKPMKSRLATAHYLLLVRGDAYRRLLYVQCPRSCRAAMCVTRQGSTI